MTADEINLEMFKEEMEKRFSFKSRGVSTLLIPASFMKHFEIQSKIFRGKPEYLSYLLRRFRIAMRSFARDPEGLKNLYQRKNQDLKKVNLRPFDEDWAELGSFSVASGRSRCLLFVILMLFDMGGFGSALKQAGIVMNEPFSPEVSWELIGKFGVEREAGYCIRGFEPRQTKGKTEQEKLE
ncbi:MAG TPA: DUF1564 family protein [Leptospiraceae bacterium]|nr:DUF1564 family protein [Leptospiraceae bacterium]HMZ62241.1 DUF1564 family protein [Leptospiraceae bacterium]HNF16948.1 DUF1564 family protein [Leptospiraceae bacterium]HNI95762.1 DUF1564 family protein [Leptospiraceae bacterium]HNM01359.1 DUF1564 family protein [Leptospiraceae bacterium]